jgi:exodeoxyribonuclease VII small subunit
MAEKKMTFEENIEKLEDILTKLEDEKLSLDASVKLYEEGMKLISKCNRELEDVERRIKILTQKPNGEIEETPVGEDDLA